MAVNFERVLSTLSARGAVVVDPCDLPAAEELQEVKSSVFGTEFKMALDAFVADHERPRSIGSLADLSRWYERHPERIPYGQPPLVATNETELGEAYIADRARYRA